MIPDLKGKVVLITGASTGIGAAAARAFAGEGGRWSSITTRAAMRRRAWPGTSERRAARRVTGGDVTVEADVKRIVSDPAAAFGRIDVLINNAGGMLGRVKIEDYTAEHIKRVLALNCTQVALFMREVVPLCAGRNRAT